ncbi:MAG: acyl carrier protein [Burkholderiaceae bacterium]|nr:acyl carrier protein [Burkholderiaceae bacterium]
MSSLAESMVARVSMSDATAAIESTIREALAVIRPEAASLPGDADLAQAADLDSADVMDLVMEIEDRLDLSIPVETMAQARTINELCAGIAQLKRNVS